MKILRLFLLPTLLLLTLRLSPALAQADQTLTLSFSRDFGYAALNGRDIQGTFSITASAPQDLVKVSFFIDDTLLREDLEPPFKIQFNTDNYPLGPHTIYAVGLTAAGTELKSKVYERNFVSAEEGWKAGLTIAGPILLLALGISLASILAPLLGGRKRQAALPPGAPRNYGMAGGAICPRCHRPFARHFLAPNLLFGKLMRCPHCGKIGIFARQSPDLLKAAEQAELAASASDQPQVAGMSADEKLRKDLEDSRYQGL